MTIKEISDLRKTQDNGWHCTSSPLYLVQKKERDYGLDSAYCDDHVWLDDSGDYNEVEDKELVEKLDDWDDYCLPEEYKGYTKVYYRDRWEFVTLFFTEKGARDYIASIQYKYEEGDLRVYVDSAYRNEELKEIIKFLESVE